VFLCFLGLGWIGCKPAHSFAEEPVRDATGADFMRQLNRPLLVTQDFTPLAEILDRLAEDRKVAILLDRRIDPERLVRVDVNSPFFDRGIETLVSPIPAAAVVVLADTVFVTRSETAETLRTRVALAEQKLEQLSKSSLQRQLALSRKLEWQWKMLSAPRDVLIDFASRFEIKIENPEAIPYDLWRPGRIAHASLIPGVLMIATQYDRDLEWVDAETIRLVPLDPDPQIEIAHVVRGKSGEQIEELMRRHFPGKPIQQTRNRLKLSARVEEHEELDILLGNRAPRKTPPSVISTTLANRRFTLRMMNRPFSELIAVLEKQGIQFERNSASLEQAGIDWNQKITLELENATIEKLLMEACTPLGLAFQIEGTRVELGLAPRPVPPSPGAVPGNPE